MVISPRSRPQTPGRSAPPEDGPLMPIPEGPPRSSPPPVPALAQRRTSLGFLRRSKSGDTLSRRSTSGSKIVKRQQAALQQQEVFRRQQEAAAAASETVPALPVLESPPPINTFGGENGTPSPPRQGNNVPKIPSITYSKGFPYTDPPSAPPSVPIPPIPDTDNRGRSESMTHRGRYSYASSMVSTVNGPRRVRRRKDPTPYNVLVIGAKSSGKTSFLNFLRASLAPPPKKKRGHVGTVREHESAGDVGPSRADGSLHPAFTSQYLETEIEGERVGLTLWDSTGLEKSIVDLQLRELNAFLESKFEETFTEEMKVIRAPGAQDTHIHCVFVVLDPTRLDANIAAAKRKTQPAQPNGVTGRSSRGSPLVGGLDEDFDVQVLRALQGKTTVVPVISKADTVTTAHMAYLKRAVWSSVKRARLDLLEALGVDDSDIEEGDARDGKDGAGADDGSSDAGDDDHDNQSSESILIRQSNVEGTSNDNDQASLQPQSGASNSAAGAVAAGKSTNGNVAEPRSSTSSSALPLLPLSIISPDEYELEEGFMGRRFAWGVADPYDVAHCDFVKLKEAVFADWRRDLREASKELWYERWRTDRLKGHADKS